MPFDNKSNIQIYRAQELPTGLILYATNRKPQILTVVVVTVYIVVIVVHVSVPCVRCPELSSTPPVTVAANAAEITIVTVATMEGL